MLPESERYAIGQKLGDVIRLLIEVIADLEKVEPQEVLDSIVEHYVAERIINEPRGSPDRGSFWGSAARPDP